VTERFTVYDIFAVLVPGAVFSFLLAITLRELAGIRILDWSGGFGDATVLLIAGYAAGVLLQAIGNLAGRLTRSHQRRGHAIARLLLPESAHYSDGFKREALGSVEKRSGSLPAPDHPEYRKLLDEKVFRLYKKIEATDSRVTRFLAEHHQMRAYAVAFTILALISLATIPLSSSPPCWVHLALAGTYGVLAALSIWRKEGKDIALARHVLARFLEPPERASTRIRSRHVSPRSR
jgi:hypothetical protein